MGRKSREKKERKFKFIGMELWHYTTDYHFNQIFKTKKIIPYTRFISETENPTTWFSTNPVWENSVARQIKLEDGNLSEMMSRDEMHEKGIKLVRIKVDASKIYLFDWKKFKKLVFVPQESLEGINRVIEKLGANYSEWYGTFDEVPMNEWLEVEIWNGEKWLDILSVMKHNAEVEKPEENIESEIKSE